MRNRSILDGEVDSRFCQLAEICRSLAWRIIHDVGPRFRRHPRVGRSDLNGRPARSQIPGVATPWEATKTNFSMLCCGSDSRPETLAVLVLFRGH